MAPQLGDRLRGLYDSVAHALHSSKGKDVLLYLMFVCVAFVFWVLLSLDTEVQRDFEVPLELEDVPDSVTLIGTLPKSLGTTVHGKSSQLIRFTWGKLSPLKIKFTENVTEHDLFSMSKMKIDSRLRDYFGNGVQIMSLKPDSLRVDFTSSPGKKVKLDIVADIHPNLQCIISGPITANVDSVKVFSRHDIPRSLTTVETEPIIRSDLKDTTRYEVRIKPLPGIRIIPDKVIVTVPVEPLISKKRLVSVDVTNLPAGVRMITFPSKIEVTYLVPISAYGDDYPFRVYVDYKDVDTKITKIPVNLSLVPEIYSNISLSPDSVEYIIERLNH